MDRHEICCTSCKKPIPGAFVNVLEGHPAPSAAALGNPVCKVCAPAALAALNVKR